MNEIPDATDTTSTNDEKVAIQIVSDFQEKGLLSAAQVAEVTEKLASGTMKEADWKRMAELVDDLQP